MPIIIGISGVSGAGKTEIADALGDRLGKATVIHWDDYDELTKSPADYVEWFARQGSYDEWIASELEAVLLSLKQGKDVVCPATGKFLKATDAIIFDTGLGYKHKQTGRLIDFLIYIDSPADISLCRRLIRDFRLGRISSAEEIVDAMSEYLTDARPVFLCSYSQKEEADLVVDGTKSVHQITAEIVSSLTRKWPGLGG